MSDQSWRWPRAAGGGLPSANQTQYPGVKAKGRPRKPLAEVIFKNAPLRATSSVVAYCIQRANLKLLKIGGRLAAAIW